MAYKPMKTLTIGGKQYEIVDAIARADIAEIQDNLDNTVSSLQNDLNDAVSSLQNDLDTHNVATDAHNDIRLLVSGLTTRLNTLADSDDTTLDQISEIVAYIKSNKNLIDSITTSKVNVTDIINNLTTNVTNKPLSAAQGVALKSLIDALETACKNADTQLSNRIDSVESELDTHTHLYAGSTTTGGAANSADKINAIQLTNEDLNELKTVGKRYFAQSGHTCANIPNGVASFGLEVYATSSVHCVQKLIKADGASHFVRSYVNGSGWRAWTQIATINDNVASASKLQTPRTITLGQQLQGSAQFDGSSDITINGQLKHCVELASNADCATYPWFKVADVVLDNVKFEDRIITFRVDNTYANQEYGVLRARVRVESNTVLQVASLQWEYASPSINPSDFVLTTIQDEAKVKAELWCKISKQANSKHFVVLHEAQRRNDANYWTLYNNTVGVASYTTGDNVTAVESVINNLKNSINGNASTATALTSSAGSATQPVYFKDGKPVAIDVDLGNLDGLTDNVQNQIKNKTEVTLRKWTQVDMLESISGIGENAISTGVISFESEV